MSVRCPNCEVPLPATAVNRQQPVACPNCGLEVHTEVFPALNRVQRAAAEPPALVVTEGEARCFQHATRRATVACDECGRLLCALCDLPMGSRHLCPLCFNAGSGEAMSNWAPARPLNGRLALTLACVPVFPPTAIAALILCATTWKKPGSLVRDRRWQYPASIIIASFQVAAALILALALLRG